MNQFNSIIFPNNSVQSQALWKYNLTENKFIELKNLIYSTHSIKDLDPRICALYYAEWWRRCYDGGTPSKEKVFHSINNLQNFDSNDFFLRAIEGAKQLNLKWISRLNTLYFRTLLLQGGLPIKCIANNKGAYTLFLLKIIELSPKSISEFAFNLSLTSLLPHSSRNNEIYQCCLDLVTAIQGNNQDYLKIFEHNEDLKEIGNVLKIKNESLSKGKTRENVKAYWLYNPQKEQIKLNLNIPDLSYSNFKYLFLNRDNDIYIEAEYKLYFNEQFIGKFIKRSNGYMKFELMNSAALVWDITNSIPDLYLYNSNQNRYNCNEIIKGLPTIEKPTLWSKYSENHWILEKGTHSSANEAWLMTSFDNISAFDNCQWEERVISNSRVLWANFEDQLTLGDLMFTTKSTNIDWYIVDDKPSWIHKANFTIVRDIPKIIVFGLNGNIIVNPVLRWRLKSKITQPWRNWTSNWPKGIIEISIEAEGVVEYDEVYCIGDCNVTIQSQTLTQAEIKFIGDGVLYSINVNSLFTIEKLNDKKVSLTLIGNNEIPTSIHGSIRKDSQIKSLIFEMYPPFKGIELLDKAGKIVPNNSELYLNELNGFRIMSNNQGDLVITLKNSTKNDIVLTQIIDRNYISLHMLTDKINNLFTLSDTMNSNAEVLVSINYETRNRLTTLKTYRIKRYTNTVSCIIEDNIGQQIIKLMPENDKVNLFAIPLDTSLNKLDVVQLNNNEGYYSITQISENSKYIVFAGSNPGINVQPSFVNTDIHDSFTTSEQRISRIIEFRDTLLGAEPEDEIWRIFLLYYNVCLMYSLPFSSFDILRSISCSSELATKAYLFLVCYDESEKFEEEIYILMERDLGFYFHWVNKSDWSKAHEWIGSCDDFELSILLNLAIKSCYQGLLPLNNRDLIINYVLQDEIPSLKSGFHLNSKINEMRQALGVKVLHALPIDYPSKPKSHNYLISVGENNNVVKILLRTPEIVSLSVCGKSDSLWHPASENKRRNVKYCYDLAPEWYTDALIYCLTNLIN